MHTRILTSLLFMLLLPAVPAGAVWAQAIDRVLVVVNEEPITLSEYQARHRREALQSGDALEPYDGKVHPEILEIMIDDRLQATTALRRGIRVARSEVERSIAIIAERNGIPVAALLEQLAGEGITADQFHISVLEQELVRRLRDAVINARVEVSDREVQNYLATHQELLEELRAVSSRYEVSHLFLLAADDSEVDAKREELAGIRAQILDGLPFAEAVAQFSYRPDDPPGGYLGWRTPDELPINFVTALQGLVVGGITDVFHSGSGLHLLELNNREGGGVFIQQRIRHVLVRPEDGRNLAETLALAQELRERIRGGEAFEKIARIYSADPDGAANGGLIGWTNPGEFPPQFDDATRALAVGEVSEPLRTGAGYHLVEVLERREADVAEERANLRARQILFTRKAEDAYRNWFSTIRDTAHIEYIGAPG